jgi:serine protease Do
LKEREGENSGEPVVNKENNESNSDESNSTAAFDNLGLTVRNLTSQEKTSYDVDHGIMITDVKPYSNAEDQRLFQGLVILEADKKEVDSVKDFKNIVDDNKGKSVMLRVADTQGNKRFVALEIPQ